MKDIFKKSLIVGLVTVSVDFLFHYFFTNPMESFTYFVIKFLLAFFVATGMFNWVYYQLNLGKRKIIVLISALIFSTLMSIYYRAWELIEAQAPFGARAPDIVGILRSDLLAFSGTWWLAHALFFAVGVLLVERLGRD